MFPEGTILIDRQGVQMYYHTGGWRSAPPLLLPRIGETEYATSQTARTNCAAVHDNDAAVPSG